MSQQTNPTRRQVLRRTGAGVATVATAAAGGTALAGRGTADSGPSGLFADEEISYSEATFGYVTGLMTGVRAWASNELTGSSSLRLEGHVDDIVEEYCDHEQDWVSWVNDRDLGSADRQSAAITFEHGDEETTRYVRADYDTSAEEYAGTTFSTDAVDDPDITATIRGIAVENAADELADLHAEFIKPNEDISTGYASRLAGRYTIGNSEGTHITSSLLGEFSTEGL
ncbi:hypothetical protein SAMN05216226_102161 [Halovenus aranensis]|uniref:Uncharacterized protein n=1 Tax=Halovenus aranensis TaxID=890420 RepID=A0A1G8SUZ9_9EURY|nr:hypothetical protein [Halovenus aranensis]SDJ33092.1 hypothetical protein SAMN05216226_102161 [Halovenus aranensis]